MGGVGEGDQDEVQSDGMPSMHGAKLICDCAGPVSPINVATKNQQRAGRSVPYRRTELSSTDLVVEALRGTTASIAVHALAVPLEF